MALVISPSKIVLLAVEFATRADIHSLASLALRHASILRKDVLLRILLTYLPETVRSSEYVDFLVALEKGELPESDGVEIDCSAVEDLTEEEATKKTRKLRLLSLSFPEAPGRASDDATTLFLIQRAYKVDEEAGLLDELPKLLLPFLSHSTCIRDLAISSVLPLMRRNCEYYPDEPIPYTLFNFQRLPGRLAVDQLLSRTGKRQEDASLIGRDLKGLIGPWLCNETRWSGSKGSVATSNAPEATSAGDEAPCPGWDRVLEWLTTQAVKSWRVAANAIQQWDGAGDTDLGGWGSVWLSDEQEDHLDKSYARAALASAYLIPEATTQAIEACYDITAKIADLLDLDPSPPLQNYAAILPPYSGNGESTLLSPRNATYLRNGLLSESNLLTAPESAPVDLLRVIILSAFLLTKGGVPCTVRRVGELVLLQDEREQMAEATKLINAMSNNGPKSDDKYWIKARNEILWLRDWGEEESGSSSRPQGSGVFGKLKKEFLEIEIVKALLANTRYSLARSLYEDSHEPPLDVTVLRDTVLSAALHAYDGASNPNRTRGGVKKCDDIIHAFPKTVEKSLPATKRIQALIRTTHALSEYRLVLKQGEPFTPIVLRVHTDPISIIGKILEQNPKSYTRIQELQNLGSNMVQAGLTVRDKAGHSVLKPEQEPEQLTIAERRITAMCIDAALTEDDFETAYSYVVNRLATPSTQRRGDSSTTRTAGPPDDYSWKAALQAGKYRRTARTLRPTHLGNASGNPEIRHLEQRLECLATALRVAPPPTLQEILNAFRRTEEELDSAVQAENEQEDAWNAAGDHIQNIPGGFGPPPARPAQTVASAARSAGIGSSASSRHQEDEAPMSLFDLSRASMLSAQKNLTSLSTLQRTGLGRGASTAAPSGTEEIGEDGQPKRVRKRDQLRDAAMGTLVSGVGWLINAPPSGTEGRD